MKWVSSLTLTIEATDQYYKSLKHVIASKYKLPDHQDLFEDLQEYKGFPLDIESTVGPAGIILILSARRPMAYPFDYKDILEDIILLPSGQLYNLHILWDICWTSELGTFEETEARRKFVPVPEDYLFWDFDKSFVKPKVLASFLLDIRKSLEQQDGTLEQKASTLILALSQHTCGKFFLPSDMVNCKVYLEAYNKHYKQEHLELVNYLKAVQGKRPEPKLFNDY